MMLEYEKIILAATYTYSHRWQHPYSKSHTMDHLRYKSKVRVRDEQKRAGYQCESGEPAECRNDTQFYAGLLLNLRMSTRVLLDIYAEVSLAASHTHLALADVRRPDILLAVLVDGDSALRHADTHFKIAVSVIRHRKPGVGLPADRRSD